MSNVYRIEMETSPGRWDAYELALGFDRAWSVANSVRDFIGVAARILRTDRASDPVVYLLP